MSQQPTRVLVLNSGSSSLKLRVFDWPSEREVCRGAVTSIGTPAADSTISVDGQPTRTQPVEASDHAAALEVACAALAETGVLPESGPAIVGHRVVHGGDRFSEATELTGPVIDAIDRLTPLAPLHNPANLLGVRSARRLYPNARHVAVFDTAFHQTMPPEAWRYALPRDLADEHGIRRYGFHGTSHRWAAARVAEILDRPLDGLRTVVLHLGAGASATATLGGRSVDTSMGMTPLAGLVMATRSGDLDPGVVFYLQREVGLSTDEVDALLNRQSGLVGLCGAGDMRDVLAAAERGEATAQRAAAEAIDAYVYRVAKQVGAYAVALGGLDAVVFTAGVGEHSQPIRARIAERLALFGARLDPERNAADSAEDRPIHAAESKVALLVVGANEELQIAREAAAAVGEPTG